MENCGALFGTGATVEAHVGDLVLVRYRGEHVAQLVDIGVVLTVRFWRPSAQVFASPRLLEREAVIGLAPDDARTAIACEELRLEGERRALIGAPCDIEIEGRRAAGFVTKLDEHGRPAEVEMLTWPPTSPRDAARSTPDRRCPTLHRRRRTRRRIRVSLLAAPRRRRPRKAGRR